MRKALAVVLLTAAFGAAWMGFAQTASAGEPHGDDKTKYCTADQVLVNAQCVNVDVNLDAVVKDVADLAGGLL